MEHRAKHRSAVQQGCAKLWGTKGSFVPDTVAPQSRDTEALRLFQSFLCNGESERDQLSNVIMLWEQIPKYIAEYLNDNSEDLPNSFEREFCIGDQTFRMTLFPGTYYPNGDETSEPRRRYPGIREQAVEQALIKIACDQAEAHHVQGETLYRVNFSIRHMRDVLEAMGSTLGHWQIREALEIMSSTIMTITKHEKSHDQRSPILPGFARVTAGAEADNSPRAYWSVQLHPLVAHAIRNVTYRQFPFGSHTGLAPYASYLIRQMHFLAPNISTEHPFRFNLSTLRSLTPGLQHKNLRYSVKALVRELDKMTKAGYLSHHEHDIIYSRERRAGRPAVSDAAFTLYPDREWIKQVMAGSKRATLSEQSLGLPRSQREERQLNLPML